MKPSPPSPPQTENGRVYWQSLDQISDSPEFRQWIEREFPEGASEWFDPVSRRRFMKIMSASFLLAGVGLTGCRRPLQKIEPYSHLPEQYVHGVPQYYATAMPTRGSALPLVVKSHEARPTKIEGNALHPGSRGGTDRYAQASILNLYDPDRAARFALNGENSTAEAAIDFLSRLSGELRQNQGRGVAFLLEPDTSPSRQRLTEIISQQCPQAKWYFHDPVGLRAAEEAASLAFGQPVKPLYHLDRADVVLSLDCDFLGDEEDVQKHIQQFAQRRTIESPQDSLNRLYLAESLMTVTGFQADHRLRIAGSQIMALALAIAKAAGAEGVDGSQWPAPAGVDPKWITACADDLKAHRGRSLVMAGHRQPRAVHLLACAINTALGNVGRTVQFISTPAAAPGDLPELARELGAGRVETLVILGGNPCYTAPADLDWPTQQSKAKTVVRLGFYEDETFLRSNWHFPAAHYLESWGDARTWDGTLAPVQPLIAPLFGGWTELEVLGRLAGLKSPDAYSITRETFAGQQAVEQSEARWRKFLHDGFLDGSAAPAVNVKLNAGVVAAGLREAPAPAPDKDHLELVFHRDYSVDDGRYNNNGWLQELPDPVTKVVWDNVVLISRKTAQELGVANSEVVEISLDGRKISGPIWVQPGLADYSLGLALGYGRQRPGRVGRNTGFDVYPLRTTQAPHYATGAKIARTSRTYPVACTQSHWSLEGRNIVREANLKQYREHPHFAHQMNLQEPNVVESLYPNPFEQLKKKGLHQWGMSIDLNKCVGCAACVVACQSENNVPIVGKEQVSRGREMHWLRIDRYYAGAPSEENRLKAFARDYELQYQKWIDDPQAVTQPMLCQHCEAAPCENVCPVNATSHDQEGLNVMTYNRCVGTRYCSNNCPYKVRRFNFFDYNKRPLEKLYLGPLARRPEDEWDMIRLIKNPEVTVRMRGVMEKCTFCLQRIEAAKIAQKVQAGASGDVVVPSDSFTTACAQACPADAIVFGNLNDPASRVSRRKRLDRDYPALESLFTRPRLTYLARVRNPNEAMPDYYEAPLTFQEFEHKMGDPFKQEHGGEPAGAAAPAGKEAH